MWKVDQNWNWVKLKLIQILLKITSMDPRNMRKSYLLIIYTNAYDMPDSAH